MEILNYILLSVYGLLLLFILLYSFIQGNLVYNYVKNKRKIKSTENDAITVPDVWPFVTVQLPVYNEKYVVERLIRKIAELDYPKEKLEIQVLDDSSDESIEIAQNTISEIRNGGINIQHIRRPDRKGFKAGALAYGTEICQGEFIAIFDADFLPEKDFLKKTIPHFKKDEIGVVQTRWEHLNEDFSLLTKLQAFGLNAHFSVEQKGRNAGGHFINFNGTAGVWRKDCIGDAGGWKDDTLTEDLDLSYRAQLKGWKFLYLENVGAPAELPAAMNALKTQQFRWTKGAAECTRKNLGKVLRASHLKFSTKIHAIFHLMNSFLFICIILTSLLSIPVLILKNHHPELGLVFKLAGIFLISLVLLSAFYWTSVYSKFNSTAKTWVAFLKYFPMFLSISMGLSLHNAIAVLEGYIGKKSPFLRTPKFAVTKKSDRWLNNKYLNHAINPGTFAEGFLALYFFTGLGLGIYYKDFGLMPFHMMLGLGFSLVFYYSFKHSIKSS